MALTPRCNRCLLLYAPVPPLGFSLPLNGVGLGIISSSLALPSHRGLETAHTSLVRLQRGTQAACPLSRECLFNR